MTIEQWMNTTTGQFNLSGLKHKLAEIADTKCDLSSLLSTNFHFIRCFLTLDKQKCMAIFDDNPTALQEHLNVVNRLWSFKVLLLKKQNELKIKCEMVKPRDVLERLLDVNKLLSTRLVTLDGFMFLIKYNLLMFVRHHMETHRYCHATQFWYGNLLRLIKRAKIEKDYSPIALNIQSKIGEGTMQDVYPFMRDLLIFLDGFNLLDEVHSELAKIAIKLLTPEKNSEDLLNAGTPTTPTLSPKRCE